MNLQRSLRLRNVHSFRLQAIVGRHLHVPVKQNMYLPSNIINRTRGDCSGMGSETKNGLLHEICPSAEGTNSKVTIVGTGAVGMACAISLLTQNVSSEVVLIDRTPEKLKTIGENLLHGSLFMSNPKITYSTNYCATEGSRVCIVTAGPRHQPGQSRLDVVQQGAAIVKQIVRSLVRYSPETVLLLVCNPVDIMTYVTWKLTGLPHHRVIGSGTSVDTARFRFLLAQKLGVATTSVHAMIIGEHGDSSVPVWSGVNVAGVPLRDFNPYIGTEQDDEEWSRIHKQVVTAADTLMKLKGYTCWTIGLSTSSIANSIIRNTMTVHPVSVYAKGYHCIPDDVYLSLPAVVGREGVVNVVNEPLSDEERCKLQQSARVIRRVQRGLKI